MHIFDTLNFFWQAEDELNWIMCYKVKSTCTVTKGEDRGHLHLTSIRVTGPLPDGIIMIVHHPRLIPNTHTHELFHTKDNQRCVLFATVCITVTDCLISRFPLAVDPFRATLLHVSYESTLYPITVVSEAFCTASNRTRRPNLHLQSSGCAYFSLMRDTVAYSYYGSRMRSIPVVAASGTKC